MEYRAHIGIIGLGTIGSGVVKLLNQNFSLIKERIGIEPTIKMIADINLERNRGIEIDRGILTRNPEEIINDPQIKIVVELVGGIHPAKEYIIGSLRKNKAVVTANKALLAEEGEEIFQVAQENKQDIYFEGSVCGGIPIIKAIREGMIADRINYLAGIINGTANYILTKMEEGLSLKESLLEAEEKEISEKDPSLDIEGTDSAHKLAILGRLIFGVPFNLKDIYVEGISSLTPLDLRFAKEFGYTLKLLAVAKKTDRSLQLRVHPALVKTSHPLATVKGVYNGVYIEGDATGEVLFYGKGAGQMPTASSVLNDIVDIIRNLKFNTHMRVPPMIYSKKPYQIASIEKLKGSYYMRIMAIDKPGVLAKISHILGEEGISIASVVQKSRKKDEVVPIVMMTHKAIEKNVAFAIREIDNLSVVKGKTLRIRVEE